MSFGEATWRELARGARSVLESAGGGGVASQIPEWSAPEHSRPITPQTLAVLHWLPQAVRAAPAGPLRELALLVQQASAALAWRQSYRAPQVSAYFLERYGWCELLGLSGPLPSATLACGILLLGPETLYPPHSHQAQELYVPLSGSAEWSCGEKRFELRAPGELIRHQPCEPHAMRTGSEPLLALYVWHGAGLAESAQLQHS
jgi:mannose-6-phosphate isomerase-like protein (cupin superfamily)